MDAAGDCVAPIWAHRAIDAPPSSVDHNGTITFLDTGTRRIAVTAQHVMQKLREVRTEYPGAGLAISLASGIAPFLSAFDVIDEDKEIDLAVLDLPDLASWPGHSKRYFPVAEWPIPMPTRGDPVTIQGFPGFLRRANDRIGVFSPAGVGMVVSNDPSRHIALVDTDGTLHTVSPEGTTAGGFNPGGLSGAAGFFFRNGRFHVAGFVYEGSPGMLFLTPGRHLSQSGQLLR